MAEAKKCDRCGKLYFYGCKEDSIRWGFKAIDSNFTKTIKPNNDDKNRIAMYGLKLDARAGFSFATLDLCPTCTQEFGEWMGKYDFSDL